jgi:hypothetical protein
MREQRAKAHQPYPSWQPGRRPCALRLPSPGLPWQYMVYRQATARNCVGHLFGVCVDAACTLAQTIG